MFIIKLNLLISFINFKCFILLTYKLRFYHFYIIFICLIFTFIYLCCRKIIHKSRQIFTIIITTITCSLLLKVKHVPLSMNPRRLVFADRRTYLSKDKSVPRLTHSFNKAPMRLCLFWPSSNLNVYIYIVSNMLNYNKYYSKCIGVVKQCKTNNANHKEN